MLIFRGSVSFIVGESSDDSSLTPTPFDFAQGRLSPDFGRGGMPLIPSSPQGISRDGSCLHQASAAATSCFCCREFIRAVVGTLSLSANFLIEPQKKGRLIESPFDKDSQYYIPAISSNLYPTPQMVVIRHGASSFSTLRLSRLTCWSTVRSSPKNSS